MLRETLMEILPAAGEEELPEKRYEAAKAKFYGMEIEVDWLALENEGWSLLLSAYGTLYAEPMSQKEQTYLE